VSSLQQEVFDFVKAHVDAAVLPNDLLHDAEVLDQPYREMTKEKGVSVWFVIADVAPSRDYSSFHYGDAVTTLACYFSAGREKANFAQAREDLEEFAGAVAALFWLHSDMDGRCVNSRVFAVRDGTDKTDGRNYWVMHLALVINETGVLTQSELMRRAFRN